MNSTMKHLSLMNASNALNFSNNFHLTDNISKLIREKYRNQSNSPLQRSETNRNEQSAIPQTYVSLVIGNTQILLFQRPDRTANKVFIHSILTKVFLKKFSKDFFLSNF